MFSLDDSEHEDKFTIEPHGDGYALYFGRSNTRHGYNLIYLNDPAFNCDLRHIEHLLNLGHTEYLKTKNREYIAE
jgi:hypothetical protein